MDKVQTTEERIYQLRQIADRILNRVQFGCCTERDRSQLLRQYDLIDKILQRHNAGNAEADYSPLDRIIDEMREEYQDQK